MPLQSIISSLRSHTRARHDASLQPNTGKLGGRLLEVFARTWDLGFTSFGGPPVHFQILHRRFVEGVGFGGGSKWIDEQTVRESYKAPDIELMEICVVSGTVRNMSGPSWPWIYQDDLLYRNDTRWNHRSSVHLLTLELAWSHWNVRTFAGRTENA